MDYHKLDNMNRFHNITIIGTGLIGGSLGMALKRKVPGIHVVGIDDEKSVEEATSLGAVDRGFIPQKLRQGLHDADLVFLCTPIRQIIELLPIVADAIQPGTLVTDVGSTKREIVRHAQDAFREDAYFIGGHPMTGSENKGVHNADALLFENAVYVLTPSQRIPQALMGRFGELLESIGAKVLLLTTTLHDRIAAAVSHLPQLMAVALVNLVADHQSDSSHFLKLAAAGFRDMTRIASSPYSVWENIIATNRDEISRFMQAYIDRFEALRQRIEKNTPEEDFLHAARHRLSIPKDTKGFLKPNFDLSVQVEDKPGTIAEIATSLAENNINIKDIEILKVREGDSGTLRLSLETADDRTSARRILQEHGYASRNRD